MKLRRDNKQKEILAKRKQEEISALLKRQKTGQIEIVQCKQRQECKQEYRYREDLGVDSVQH